MAKVLVVNDSPQIAEFISKKLQENDRHSSYIAIDGEMALEFLEKITFELVITNYQMPRMDGLTLLKRLRADERFRTLPVIVDSADRSIGPVAIREGANEFLVVPFSTLELIEMVNRCLLKGQPRRLHGQAVEAKESRKNDPLSPRDYELIQAEFEEANAEAWYNQDGEWY